MKSVMVKTSATLVLSCVAMQSYANAQESYFERNRYTAVEDRAQPEFDPLPVRLGQFETRPELDLEAGYRSNLYATSQNETEDTFLVIRPSITGRSIWSRHSLGFRLDANSTNYSDNSDESFVSYGTEVFGTLDVSSATAITANVGYDQNNEPRSAAASVVNAKEPTEYATFAGSLEATHETGRLRLRGRVSATDFDYDDVSLIGGGTRDQDFRDNTEVVTAARVSWAVERDWAVFGEASYVDRSYDDAATAGRVARDAEGVIGRAGVNFELPMLIRGDVAVGYQSFDYEDPIIEDIEGTSIEANAQWFPSQLTTVSASAQRRVTDPGLIDSPGTMLTSLGVGIDHEFKRNIVFGAGIDFANFDFEGINREDDRFTINVNSIWKLNRNVWFDAKVEHVDQDSDVQSFTDDRIMVGLRLFP